MARACWSGPQGFPSTLGKLLETLCFVRAAATLPSAPQGRTLTSGSDWGQGQRPGSPAHSGCPNTTGTVRAAAPWETQVGL